jgi:dihydroxyacetone kinase-like protein
MKKFINDPMKVADEMVEGFLAMRGDSTRKLETSRVIVRKDAPVANKVAVVTGGGSGHEPALLGYVGKGMLDAVVVGEIFTSPPPGAILDAIKATHSGKGVLLLLGNYAGDKMNFQMAAELAQLEGIAVEQSIADDDVGSGPSDRRGVAGEFFIWKITGARAEAGGSLQECLEVSKKVNSLARTFGVAISPCTVPAKGTPTFTLAEDEMEYGVGHHGEAGLERIKMMPVDQVVERMTNAIIEDLPFRKGDEVAVLVNGLGATPVCELYIVYRKVKRMLDARGIAVYRPYVGEYFTALEMAGFSITLLNVDAELKGLLAAPCDTLAHRVV